MAATTPAPVIGIALGGGSARGWAHIGVLAALAERGIEPQIICGTSIGALVGGIYAAGKLGELESWVMQLTRREVLALLDFTLGGGGAIAGKRLIDLYRKHLGDITIEELPRRFAAVATDLGSGSEIWLQEGSLLDAIRASISIPGLFTPVFREGRWLADGGLVNPVPVNLCRVLGAELVIAVDLHGASLQRSSRGGVGPARPAVVRDGADRSPSAATEPSGVDAAQAPASNNSPPPFGWVVQSAFDIMQIRLSRSRLAGDPPDLLLTPRVLQVPSFEFTRGRSTIEEGRNAVRRMMPALNDLIGLASERHPLLDRRP
ncbi:MAG TPA: patatin-like phospholipase family protein [Longimicrobiaceae bacterium]